jgi:quercetin dioxygenase-like cupin family protein
MRIALFSLCIIVSAAALPQGAVPVEEEPYHRTVFKNDYVQAFRVTLEPGRSTGMHTHARDDVAVRLSNATTAAENLGEPVGPPQHGDPGLVSARDNGAKPITHRVHNVGTTVYDVVDVQILSRPAGPPAPAISPPAAENASMRVYRYELGPGVETARHTHARPYVILVATDADLRMTSPEGASMEHAVKAGDIHWAESPVTHTLANRGSDTAILVEIELK